MFKSYIKIAWRNVAKNKVYTALNVFGLALGVGVSLMIALWINYQYSFNKFLPDHQRLYQVVRRFNSNGDTVNYGNVSLKLADVLRNNFPEFEHVAETDFITNHGLLAGDKKLYPLGIVAGGDFLKMFRFRLISGTYDHALRDPYSIVLSQSTAKALFGNVNALNRTVRVDNHDNLRVSAIMQDLPANSSFQFGFIIPFSLSEINQKAVQKSRVSGFEDNEYQLFAELKPGIAYAQVAPKIRNIEKSETGSSDATNSAVIMTPLDAWHLNYGIVIYVRIFGVIAILVLLTACINFVNLSTARSEKRAKEVGVRKAVGSRKKDLVLQFLTESALVTLISFIVSLLLVQLSLPAFNMLTGASIVVPYNSYLFWLAMSGFLLVVTLLAGSKPAFYLSSFDPVKVLKGTIRVGRSAAVSRKILVVAQFTCSIALIITTLVIYQQVQYVRDRPIGYTVNRLITTNMNDDLLPNYNALQHDMVKSGVVQSVTTASSPPSGVWLQTDLDQWPGKLPGETVDLGNIVVSGNYFKTMGMRMKNGRDFSANTISDTSTVILNEAAVKRLRLTDPINQIIRKKGRQYRIIGVVKDALMNSPFGFADPTIFQYGKSDLLIYRLSPNVSVHQAVSKLTVVFNKYSPNYPFQCWFEDDEYNSKFNDEVMVGKLSGIFATLAIGICALGLFGLAAFVAQQRRREVGIRKVLGASATQVWVLLSRDFILLVLISCLIASAIAVYFLQIWLMHYDYHITLGPGVFIISSVAAIVITLITVSAQSLKAALTNPVKSLKSE